ncbi:MAG: Ycf66 family protein [Pleurocapsa sp.]
MVNFGLNSASILGIFLAVAGASLYFMRSVRPELSRDHDIFFAAVGLLCGFILLFQGWRLDPILQFGQFLLTGSVIFFAVESIRLRGVATEQARRNTPIVDRDRPVSRTRVYTEAELDKIDPYETYEGTPPNYDSPRLRGYDDPQPRTTRRSADTRRTPYTDTRDEPRTRSSRSRYNREPVTDADATSETRPPRRRSSPSRSNGYSDRPEVDKWDRPQSTSSRPRPRPTAPEERYSPPPTPSKRKPNPADLGRSYDVESEEDYGRDYISDRNTDYGKSFTSDKDLNLGRSYEDEDEDTIDSEYVDYQPIDDPQDDYSDYPEDSNAEEDRDFRREDTTRNSKPIDFDY